MKACLLAGALAAVLGLSGVADACHQGTHHQTQARAKGVKGKITAIGKKSFTLAAAAPNAGQVFTVNYGTGSTITGAAHGTIDSSMIGDSASVVGPENVAVINASHIVIAHHAKHAA
jgi:hypothetical protein